MYLNIDKCNNLNIFVIVLMKFANVNINCQKWEQH